MSNTPLPSGIPPVVRRALEIMREDPRRQEDIGARAGVGRATFHNWRTRGGAAVSTLEAVLNTLGYRLAVVPLAETERRYEPVVKAARALLSRDDFWAAALNSGVGVPGEVDALAEAIGAEFRVNQKLDEGEAA